MSTVEITIWATTAMVVAAEVAYLNACIILRRWREGR